MQDIMNKNVLLISIIMLILTSGCASQQKNAEKGFLEGKITIGPLCPVERDPPDPRCQPTQETYGAWQLAVFTTNKKEVAKIKPNLDGTYNIELLVGKYIVDFENKQSFGFGSNNLPADILIESGKTSTLEVDIDTGMR